MVLRVKDDVVQLETVIGTNSTQTVTEGTVTIPNSMLAADRVVKVIAIPQVVEQWVEEDRVNIDGTVAVTLIYSGHYDTGQAYYGSLQVSDGVPFSHFVGIPGAMPQMQSKCDVTVLDLESALRSDGRTVDLDLVLELAAKAIDSQEATLVTDVTTSGLAKIKVAKETLHIEDVIGKGTAQIELRETLPLPAAGEITPRLLELQGRFRMAEKRVTVDKAVISGTMSYKATCAAISESTGEEHVVVYRWDDVSRVELSTGIPGSHSGMVAYPQIASPIISGRLVGDRQVLAVEGVLTAEIKVVQPLEIKVLTDLLAETDTEVGIRRELIQVQQVGETVGKDVYVDGTVGLSESRPAVERLLDIEARAKVTNASAVGGRALVSGYVDLAAMYVGRTDDFSQPVYHASWGNAGIFEANISVPTASTAPVADVEATVIVEDARAELLSRDTIGFHVTARVLCRVQESMTKEVVAEAVELRKFKGRPPTYTCVIMQPEDTLWKLATKYRTSMESLMENNPVLAETIVAGALPVGGKIVVTKSGTSSLS